MKKLLGILIELTRETSETAHFYLRAFDRELYPQLIGIPLALAVDDNFWYRSALVA